MADAGELPAFSPGDTVTLDGSGSTDADGHALTYQWTQVSGTTVALSGADTANPTFTAPQLPQGQTQFNVVFSLTVNDGYVDSEPDTTAEDAANTKPVAEAGTDQTVQESDLDEAGVVQPVRVTLNGSASTDAEGDPLTYAWTQISTGTQVTLTGADTASPTFTAPQLLEDEDLGFELIVNDGKVDSAPDTVTVTVQADNDKPTAEAGEDISVHPDDSVTLGGSSSSDPEEQPLSYAWRQDSGTIVTLSSTTVESPTFTAPELPMDETSEELVFELIVNDGMNNSDPDTVTVTIGENAAAHAGCDHRSGQQH